MKSYDNDDECDICSLFLSVMHACMHTVFS